MPFGRDENGTEGEGHANVVGAQDHIQDGNQLQLCASVLASRSAVVLGTVEMGVYNGRTAHDVRMLEQGYICVINAEQSY